MNQRKPDEKDWHEIGTSYLIKGSNKLLTIDNSLLVAGEYVSANAVMAMLNRNLSPDVIV